MKHLGNKVVVLGLGKTGYESARFLHRKGFKVFASELTLSGTTEKHAGLLKNEAIDTECGRHTFEKILGSDWALVSPGIAPQTPVYQAIRNCSMPVYSEIEVASWYSATSHIIGVTGTCGKTTVTTLASRVFTRHGKRAVTCGNIGTPWIREVSAISAEDVVILELSSFQLMHCRNFRPEIGILLNISRNHEDWHADFNEYLHAKLRLFQNQEAGDYAILRREDHTRFFMNYPFRSRVIYFPDSGTVDPNEEVVRQLAGLYRMDPEVTEDVIRNFGGVEHRLEKVAVSRGVTYVNDSKSTTTASLVWALGKFADRSVILIAGGHPKCDDFDRVREDLIRKAGLIIVLGEAKERLYRAWQGTSRILKAADLEEAVAIAEKNAQPQDTILLSPACASFDMFANYEERGHRFKEIVLERIGAHVRAKG